MTIPALLIGLLFYASLNEAGAATFSVPPKFNDSAFSTHVGPAHRFSSALVANAEFVTQKREERRACRRSTMPDTLAPAAGNFGDDIASFLESPRYLRRLEQMEAAGLLEARVARQPWSADYWPIARGVLGARNFELAFKIQPDWRARARYVEDYPAPLVLEKRGEEALAKLSPSEKYELIVGDDAGKLTASMWQQGRDYYDRTGDVESWMGICHGWAPAAIADPRPASAVTIPSHDGKWNVPLAPAEIKGIVSYNWATNRFNTLMLGGRCNEKDPKRDANGRLIDPECFDLNPATWHVVMVNKVGRKKESFVMDATFDYEVWNQPVLGYSYSYFNPETGLAGGLADSTIPAASFVDDPYRAYRKENVQNIVGIRMKVGYVVETAVTNSPTDHESEDFVRWVEYAYDLELDAGGNIVGGEWHLAAHPDFIWVPRTGFRPQSPLDRALANETWDDGAPVPEKWSKAARAGAARGLVLDTLTVGILRRSAAPGAHALR